VNDEPSSTVDFDLLFCLFRLRHVEIAARTGKRHAITRRRPTPIAPLNTPFRCSICRTVCNRVSQKRTPEGWSARLSGNIVEMILPGALCSGRSKSIIVDERLRRADERKAKGFVRNMVLLSIHFRALSVFARSHQNTKINYRRYLLSCWVLGMRDKRTKSERAMSSMQG
jgi:hypothetical protein